MSGTHIKYNGIEFQDVLTRDINQEVVYDSTGLNPLYTLITIEADVTIVSQESASSTGLGFRDDGILSSVISDVQAAIMSPREAFLMTIDGTTLFDVIPAETPKAKVPSGTSLGRIDVNNGPKASLSINQIVGNKVARCTFRIEMAVPNCGSLGVGDGLLNLRFWTADVVDENWYTTRTFHGRLRVAAKNFNPHSFRNFIFPPVAGGFKRERVSLQEDPNGLELEFTVVDRETYTSCPKPATTWRGTHNITFPFIGGIIGESEVRVELEGPRDTSKADLIQLGIKIIDSKLGVKIGTLQSVEGKGKAILLNVAMSEQLHENKITVGAKVRHTTSATGSGANNIFSETAGQQLVLDDYDVNRARPWGPPTASLSGIVLQRLGTSCRPAPGFSNATTSAGTKTKENTKPAGDGEEPKVTATQGELGNYEAKYSEEQSLAPYNVYRLSSEYGVPQGNVGLPVGESSSSSNVSQVVVRLHQPIATRTIRVVAERVGDIPRIPKPLAGPFKLAGITYTLKHWNVNSAATALSGDGNTEIFHVEGIIEYFLDRAPDPSTDSLPIGQNPALSNVVTTRLPSSMFSKDLATQ